MTDSNKHRVSADLDELPSKVTFGDKGQFGGNFNVVGISQSKDMFDSETGKELEEPITRTMVDFEFDIASLELDKKTIKEAAGAAMKAEGVK